MSCRIERDCQARAIDAPRGGRIPLERPKCARVMQNGNTRAAEGHPSAESTPGPGTELTGDTLERIAVRIRQVMEETERILGGGTRSGYAIQRRYIRFRPTWSACGAATSRGLAPIPRRLAQDGIAFARRRNSGIPAATVRRRSRSRAQTKLPPRTWPRKPLEEKGGRVRAAPALPSTQVVRPPPMHPQNAIERGLDLTSGPAPARLVPGPARTRRRAGSRTVACASWRCATSSRSSSHPGAAGKTSRPCRGGADQLLRLP
jgi:hypothetical protein